MEYLANALTEKLIKCQVVKNENKELYVYGFWQGVIFVFNLITVIIVGLLFGMLWQSLVFMVAYGLLRPMAGGYHARTQRSCYILSVLLIVGVLTILTWFSWNTLTLLILLAVSVGVVFILAPVEDRNKPLDEVEQRVYKKRSCIMAVLLFLIAILFVAIDEAQIANCIAISIATSATMLILGKIKNYTQRS